jgi:alkanesulfonate monooxygenase SsuD/methylene tetrahydromethanopterin reductase-like flavin-dependent oxidoreductase (luciferase family)
VKVRVGIGLGVRTALNGPELGEFVDTVERLRFDSLWLSERISGEAPDPVVATYYAAGRTTRLKFGMSGLVLPGRNPIVLAKEMATLAIMSGGRLLPAFGVAAHGHRVAHVEAVQRGDRVVGPEPRIDPHRQRTGPGAANPGDDLVDEPAGPR